MMKSKDRGWTGAWGFFLATYVIAWLLWTPAIALRGEGPTLLLIVLGAFAPSSVGIVFTVLTKDREGRRDFWRRVIDLRRIGWRWLAVIVLFYPTVNGLAYALALVFGQTPPALDNVITALGNPLMIAQIVVANLVISGFSEELGWRGYALDRLQARWNPLTASLILGSAHGLWHLPLFFIPGITQGEMGLLSWSALAFLVAAVTGAVAMTWVYNNTGRSILSAILMHFVANVCGDLLAGLQGAIPATHLILYAGIFVLVDVLIVATWRPGFKPVVMAGPDRRSPFPSAAAVGPRSSRRGTG